MLRLSSVQGLRQDAACNKNVKILTQKFNRQIFHEQPDAEKRPGCIFLAPDYHILYQYAFKETI